MQIIQLEAGGVAHRALQETLTLSFNSPFYTPLFPMKMPGWKHVTVKPFHCYAPSTTIFFSHIWFEIFKNSNLESEGCMMRTRPCQARRMGCGADWTDGSNRSRQFNVTAQGLNCPLKSLSAALGLILNNSPGTQKDLSLQKCRCVGTFQIKYGFWTRFELEEVHLPYLPPKSSSTKTHPQFGKNLYKFQTQRNAVYLKQQVSRYIIYAFSCHFSRFPTGSLHKKSLQIHFNYVLPPLPVLIQR